MQDLKIAILKEKSNFNETSLDKLLELTDKHKLRWVPSGDDDTGAYYIMSELSIAKGLESTDYIKHWATTSEKGISSERLSGKHHKLNGIHLKEFKKRYEEKYGESLGRINSLYIGDFERAYSYLIQGATDVAKGFQSLGANAIENDVKGNIEEIKEKILEQPLTEALIQKGVLYLTAYSNIKFRFEVGIKNRFISIDNASYRRFDWIELNNKTIKIYELKLKPVTEKDIRDKLNKRYIELAASEFKNKKIDFIFTSTKGITWEAKDYIKELMQNKNKYIELYPDIFCKIIFKDLQEISTRIIKNIVKNNPVEYKHYLLELLRTKEILPIVSERTINKLNTQYKLTA